MLDNFKKGAPKKPQCKDATEQGSNLSPAPSELLYNIVCPEGLLSKALGRGTYESGPSLVAATDTRTGWEGDGQLVLHRFVSFKLNIYIYIHII